jgi:hypothetical protein
MVTPKLKSFKEIVEARLQLCLPGSRREHHVYLSLCNQLCRCEFSWCESSLDFEHLFLQEATPPKVLIGVPEDPADAIIRYLFAIANLSGHGKIIFKSRGNGKKSIGKQYFEVICVITSRPTKKK